MKRALLCAKNIHMHDSEFIFFESLVSAVCLSFARKSHGNIDAVSHFHLILCVLYDWSWMNLKLSFQMPTQFAKWTKKNWNGTPNRTKLWWNECQMEKKVKPMFELAKATMQVKAINDNGNCLKITNGKYKCFYC